MSYSFCQTLRKLVAFVLRSGKAEGDVLVREWPWKTFSRGNISLVALSTTFRDLAGTRTR